MKALLIQVQIRMLVLNFKLENMHYFNLENKGKSPRSQVNLFVHTLIRTQISIAILILFFSLLLLLLLKNCILHHSQPGFASKRRESR